MKITSNILGFLLIGWISASAADVSTNSVAGKPPLQIVTCRKGVDMEALIQENGLTPKFRYRALGGFAAPMPEAVIQKLKADPRVMFVEADGPVAPCGLTNQQVIGSGLVRIGFDHFPPAHINGTPKSLDVDVAVFDAGIDPHTDLNTYAWFSPASDNPSDLTGHGAAVAGVIGATDNSFGVVGVAPGVRIWNIKCTNTGGGWTDVVSAMDYIFEPECSCSNRISVANMSFGPATTNGPAPTGAIHYFLQQMVQAGIVVVAAAGNFGQDIAGLDGIFGTQDDFIPASDPYAMAVSAMDPTIDPGYGLSRDVVASFSNFSQAERTNSGLAVYTVTNFVSSPGGAIDVVAPGVNIATTAWAGTNAPETRGTYYQMISGTSLAAPHVTGLVALYIATHGRATNAAGVFAIRQAIINAAQPQSQWKPHGYAYDSATNNTGDPDTHPEPLAMASESLISPPLIMKAFGVPGNFQVQFATLPGYIYTLQSATDLTPPVQWADVTTRVGTNGLATVSITDSNIANQKFYRLARKALPEGPFIVVQPQSLKRPVGETATFHTTTGGVAPLGCYWQKDGAPLAAVADIDGPSDKVSLTLTNVQFADAGGYTLVVTNASGSVTSAVTTLTILTNWTSASVTGVVATATSELGPPYSRYAANTVDGLPNVWESAGVDTQTGAGDFFPAITFDLGTARALNSVQIWSGPEPAPALNKMTIQVSSDGVGFNSLGVFTLTTLSPASETISLGGVVARYVRFANLASSAANRMVEVSEVAFQEYLGD